MYSIGIDIGTTSICAILLDRETGRILRTESEANGAFVKTEHEWEKVQDVCTIVSRTFEALGRIPLDKVESIGVTGQMHGIVYFNKEGKAVSNLYTWQDGRGAEYTEMLGCATGYGSVTDYYNREHGLVPEDAVGFCTIHDYVVMLLTGRKKPLVHASDAASFGCYDIVNNRFTRKNDFYPDVCSGAEVAGFYKDIPVSVAIGDNQAGFIGSGCGPDDVLVNVGTGAQVTVASDRPGKSGGEIETRPLYGGKYIFAGSSLCGGRSFALLEKLYREIAELSGNSVESMYGKIGAMLEEDDSTALEFDNRFSGTREYGKIRGSISNISVDNFTARDLAAGCVKGIAKELHDIYLKMNCGKNGRIVGSGNGIRKNKALVRYLEKMFGMELALSPYTEEAAAGAAIFGGTCADRLLDRPLFFEKNRVFRVYTGGALMDEYTGAETNGGDGFYPEEWIASSVEAINRVKAYEKEGVSRIKGAGLCFDDLMRIYPDKLKGGKDKRGVLVKYLDSAVRLPMQAHPDKKFAMEHFGSMYGKEEAWLVLATRPGAKIFYGFKEGATEEKFREAVSKCREDREAAARMMKEFDVKAGDVFFIPAKKVHAIGYGCLILEAQEPTDFTIQPEYFCGDYEMNDFERFIGLSEDDAYRCFEYAGGEDKMTEPENVYDKDGVRKDVLIGEKQTKCFSMIRYTLKNGGCVPEEGGCVVAVTEGKGKITRIGNPSDSAELEQGDYFYLPYCCTGKYMLEGDLTFVCCCSGK